MKRNPELTMSRLSERIENFNKAYVLYEQAHAAYFAEPQNQLIQLAMIQGFEIVFELGWKCLKDYLASKNIEEFTPRDVIKAAFKSNILSTAQIWIDMAKDRNASSHEYNEKKVAMIIEKIGSIYFEELTRFHSWLGEINE